MKIIPVSVWPARQTSSDRGAVTVSDPAEALRRAQLDLLRPDGALRDSLGPHLAAGRRH